MAIFREYAEFYDILYSDKDYSAEVDFVLRKLEGMPSGMDLLELGCGTGRHAEILARQGVKVTGADLSAEMVAQAGKRCANLSPADRPEFIVSDLRTLRLPRKYDSIISLFHVFSYQTSNQDLCRAFETAASHLKPGGQFLFDFWYGPAVLHDPPVVRVRRVQGSDFTVTRIAEPALLEQQNSVQVSYELIFQRNSGASIGSGQSVRESHAMRYLFLPEIEQYLNDAGLQMITSGAWMSDAPLSLNSWYGWALARLK